MAYDAFNDFGSVKGAGIFTHDEVDLHGNKTGTKLKYIDRHYGKVRDGLYCEGHVKVVVIPTGTAPTGTFTVTLGESSTETGTYEPAVQRTFDMNALANGRDPIGMKLVLDFPAYHKQFLQLSVSAGTDGGITGTTFLGYVDIAPHDDYSEAVGM